MLQIKKKKKSNSLGNKSVEGILHFTWMKMPRMTPHPEKTFVGKVIFGKHLMYFYSQNFLVIFSHLIYSRSYWYIYMSGINSLIDVTERVYYCSAFTTPFQHVDIFLYYSACQYEAFPLLHLLEQLRNIRPWCNIFWQPLCSLHMLSSTHETACYSCD